MRLTYSAFIALLIILASGCASFRNGPFGGKGEIKVLDADFDKAVEVAVIVVTDNFRKASIGRSMDGARLQVFTAGGMVREDDVITIEPMLVANLKRADDYGFVYRIEVASDDPDALPGLEYFRSAFFAALDKYLAENKIRTKAYDRFNELADKSLPEKIPATVPVTYDGFRSYLDGLGDKDGYQGIWATPDRRYVVGLIKDETLPPYKYTGFIIESTLRNWRPGEIFLRVNNIQDGQCTTGTFLLDNKVKFDAVFETGKDFLHAANSPDVTDPFILVKEYPMPEVPVPAVN